MEAEAVGTSISISKILRFQSATKFGNYCFGEDHVVLLALPTVQPLTHGRSSETEQGHYQVPWVVIGKDCVGEYSDLITMQKIGELLTWLKKLEFCSNYSGADPMLTSPCRAGWQLTEVDSILW